LLQVAVNGDRNSPPSVRQEVGPLQREDNYNAVSDDQNVPMEGSLREADGNLEISLCKTQRVIDEVHEKYVIQQFSESLIVVSI